MAASVHVLVVDSERWATDVGIEELEGAGHTVACRAEHFDACNTIAAHTRVAVPAVKDVFEALGIDVVFETVR